MEINVIFALFRAVVYILSGILFSRMLHSAIIKYELCKIIGKGCKQAVEDIILYSGFMLMFAGLTITTLVLSLLPEYGELSRTLINPGAILVFIALIRRLPRWIKERVENGKPLMEEYYDALRTIKRFRHARK